MATKCLKKFNKTNVNQVGIGVENYSGQTENESFVVAVRFPMLLAQYLCLIPLSTEHFKWTSLRTGISLMMIFCQMLMAILSFLWLQRSGASIFKSGAVLFFGGAAIMMSLMIRLAWMWPKLTKKWSEIEFYFGYQKNLKRSFCIISTLIILFSFVEHLSNLFLGLMTYQNYGKVLKKYAANTFPQVFKMFSYTIWRALPVLYVNTVSTLMYSVGDQLLIMISSSLGNYFRIFNDEILLYRDKSISPIEWKLLRLKYSKLCTLTELVDDCLCHLLCVTFLIHLYIVCVGMHQGFLFTSDAERIHAVLSFVVSALRACAVCYSTVQVHEQSRHILNVLYAVPSLSYCLETELFMQDVLRNEIALTGSHMFAMKRNFLLTIGGTVVSYQVLMLQIRDLPGSGLDIDTS